jgi:hypothetical protein
MAANMVIVESIPSSLFKPGTLLGGQKIQLADGESVTLSTCDDKLYTITGPYSDTPQPPEKCTSFGKRWLETLKKLFRTDQAGDSLRGDEDSLWTIDVSTTANYCIQETAILWRPDSSETVELSLAPVNLPTQRVTLNWPADETTLDWPSALPLKYNTTYAASMGDQTVNFLVQKISADHSNDRQLIMWLMDKNCRSQAHELFNRGEWLDEMEE